MSPQDHNPEPTGEDRARRGMIRASRAEPASPDRLTHELAGLLDGSLRHVSLALTRLRQAEGADDAPLLENLRAADRALRQMATLIRRWSRGEGAAASLFDQAWTLAEAVDHAVQLLQPTAIELRVDLSPDAAALPAGPLYSAIANGLRNAVEATCPTDVGRVELTAVCKGGELVVRIVDTGPGLDPAVLDGRGRFRFGRTTKPTGHGVGLRLAREILESLDGSVELTNRPDRGAELVLRCPAAALTSPS